LIAGGDTRLRVNDATGLNGYGCQPFPRPAEYSLSSSTASTISPRAYAAAGTIFQDLYSGGIGSQPDHVFDELAERVRHDLKTFFAPSLADVEIVLAPSGTDAQLHAFFLAGRILEKPTTSVVVAADESGSGVGFATSGRHFDSITAGGRPVVRGEPIAGLASEGMSIPVVVRDRHGDPLPMSVIDETVRQCVSRVITAGHGAILHVMNHSKTGGHYPSPECVRDMISTFGPQIQVVVDACQTRLSRSRLRWYLELGCIVLLTGSKFFCGPPLSGAVLVPGGLAARMAELDSVPDGLIDYTTRFDWPPGWTSIRSALPKRLPIGPLLRWTAAIEEMHAYFAVPEFVRKLVLREFAAATSRSIERFPHLQLVATPSGLPTTEGDDDEFEVRTIYPLLIRRGAQLLSHAQSGTLYRALNQDVSLQLRRHGTAAEVDLTARLCHVGQPVAIADGSGGKTGAIRISADARLVSECWSPLDQTIAIDKMQRRLGEIRTTFDKLQILLQHFDEIDKAYAESL
jgi:hypothetical protein